MELIRNIEKSRAQSLKELVEYESGRIVSLTLAKQPGVGMTLFAFDEGEMLSTHTAPGDAMVYVLDGSVEITVDGVKSILKEGDTIVMPCGIPHSLKSITPFKMLLTVVFPPK